MAESKPEPKVELSQDALLAMIEELKKPYVDPKTVEQKERERREMREEWERTQKLQQEMHEACTHLREDNTSAMAWIVNSDHVTRGVCQRCGDLLKPGHPRYVEMLRVPTRGSGVIYA